jgi:poly(A) polymerase
MRVREDYLRLLRFFRFYARYGRGAPDAEALAAARRHAGQLARLAAERIHQELTKFLEAGDPGPAAQVIHDYGILQAVLPEASRPDRLAALAAIERTHGVAVDPLRRLAAWLDLAAVDPDRLFDRLRLSKKENKHLARLVRPAEPVRADMDPVALKRPLHKLGAAAVRDLYLLDAAEWAAAGVAIDDRQLTAAFAAIDGWRAKRLPVDGADVKAAGVPPGPAIKRMLDALDDWWIARDFEPDRAACLAELHRRVAAGDDASV